MPYKAARIQMAPNTTFWFMVRSSLSSASLLLVSGDRGAGTGLRVPGKYELVSSGGVAQLGAGAGVLEEEEGRELAGTARREVERDSLGWQEGGLLVCFHILHF